jgi:hypothetical protein
MFSTGQLLLSKDSVHKVDLPKGWIPLALLFGVIGILVAGVVYTNESNDGIPS